MTAPDYVTVEWSPTRQLAVVRMTCDEIPVDECDEAAHQLLACGNLARRMNTPPAKRVDVTAVSDPEPVTIPAESECPGCGHAKRLHLHGYGDCTACDCSSFGPPVEGAVG